MITTKSRIYSELVIALLLGGASFVLMLNLGGVEQIGSYIETLVAPDPVVYYLFSLTVAYAIAWGIDHMTFPEYRHLKYLVAFIVYCLQQAGSGTLGLYRVVGGAAIGFAAIWPRFEPNTEVMLRSSVVAVFGISCVFAAFWLSWLNDFLAKHTSDPLVKLQRNEL